MDKLEKYYRDLESDNVGVRHFAMLSLAELRDHRATERLIEGLNDRDGVVRAHAATGLGLLQTQQAVPTLIALIHDSEADLAAIKALGQIGDPSAIKPLMTLLTDDSHYVRAEAVSALRQLESKESFEAIIDLLDDIHPSVRLIAVEAMVKIGLVHGLAIEAHLRKMLDDEIEQIRFLAAKRLEGFGSSQPMSAKNLTQPKSVQQNTADMRVMMFNNHLLQNHLSFAEYETLIKGWNDITREFDHDMTRMRSLSMKLRLFNRIDAKDLPPHFGQVQFPTYAIARCPYCLEVNKEKLDTYSLKLWRLGTGIAVFDYRLIIHHCKHFALVEPFFHFHGRWPDDAKGQFTPEVPHVIGHLLENYPCKAVIHALPICRIIDQVFEPSYTLFMVSYFAEYPKDAYDAVIEFNVDYVEPGVAWPFIAPPEGCDHWWNLKQWVATEHFYWIDGHDSELTLSTGDTDNFPYGDIKGRTWPYLHVFPNPLPKRSTKLK